MASTRSAIARTAVACLAAISVLLTGYALAAPSSAALSTSDAAGYQYDSSANAAKSAGGTQRAGEAGESGEVSLGLTDGFAQVDGSGSLRSLVAPSGTAAAIGPAGNPGAFPALSAPTPRLQHAFKHADDFGVTGNWNNANVQALR